MQKSYLQIAACVLVILTVLVLFFYSGDIFGFTYPFSYPLLQDSCDELGMLKDRYLSTQDAYERHAARYVDLVQMKNSLESVGESTDWSLHLPSVLIYLEQNAANFNLDFLIDVDAIRRDDMFLEVPVVVSGSYKSACDYLKFLGGADFIYVSNVDMKLESSEGLDISILLEVYYDLGESLDG